MEKERSIGITVCSVSAIVLGVLHIALFFFTLYLAHKKHSILDATPVFQLSLKNILWLLLPLLYIVSGSFLLLLKRWVRLFMLTLTGIYLVDILITLTPDSVASIKTLIRYRSSIFECGPILIPLLVNILIVLLLLAIFYYLTRPKVKEQFK